jgi:hypothetical protein
MNLTRTILMTLFFALPVSGFAADPPLTDVPPSGQVSVTAAAVTTAPAISTSRGSILLGLYVSNIALNAYDGFSTAAALQHGGVEANPFMKGVAGNPMALWGVKAGMTAASIVIAERLWRRHHRGQAIGMMIAMNGIMTAVAMNNASVLRSAK